MTSDLPKTEKLKIDKSRAAASATELTAAKTALAAATNDADRAYAIRRVARATELLRQANLAIALDS